MIDRDLIDSFFTDSQGIVLNEDTGVVSRRAGVVVTSILRDRRSNPGANDPVRRIDPR